MEGCLSIAVCLIDISTLLYQGLDQPDFELDNSEVQWAPVNTPSHVYVNVFLVNQNLGCSKLLVANGEAKRRTVVFIEDVRVCIPLQKTFKHAVIPLGSRVMQRCPLPVVLVVHFKV